MVFIFKSLTLFLVIPAGALQTDSGLHTLAVSGGGAGGAIVQYATNQDEHFYVPGWYSQLQFFYFNQVQII